MSISLCCIVKNEQPVIADMLASVQGVVDEIIVVDTGSSDNTVEIASSYATRIEKLKWNDDFAEARNFSISLAKTDWIFVLDADERLDAEHRDLVSEIGRDLKTDKAFFLQRRHYQKSSNFPFFRTLSPSSPYASLGAKGYYETIDIRIFPNNDAIRFQGALHESAEDAIRVSGTQILTSNIFIDHVGGLLESRDLQQKADFYLSLARRKLEANPDDWRNWYQLGAEYQGTGDIGNAVLPFEKVTQMEPENALGWRQLGLCMIAQGKISEALLTLRIAAQKNANCPMTWNAIGICLKELGFKDEAALCFQTALNIDSNNQSYALNLKNLES